MQWSAQPIGDSYLTVALLTAALAGLLMLRPRYRSLSPQRQHILTALRVGVILLVMLALLRPALVKSSRKPQSASFILMFDQSRSMQLPGASGDVTRWQSQADILQRCLPALRKLAERLEVKLYGFDDQLHRVELEGGKIVLPKNPLGRQTDIGTSLHDALRREAGGRVAGVLMLSDGAQTAFDPKTEVQAAGRELARLGAPLYAAGFGPAGDAAQSRDIAVENMPDRYTAFVKNELEVRGALRVRGYVNQEIPVQLIVENERGERSVQGTLRKQAQQDDQQVEVAFTYTPPEPGQYKLTMIAEAQTGELLLENNQLTAFLTVREGGVRILYLDIIRWERKFLRRAVDASLDIELDVLSIDPRGRDRWPVQLDPGLSEGRYDAIIIGDVDSSALGPANLQLIADAVDRGAGLVMLGGYHSFGPGGYRVGALSNVLPVEMGRFERQDYNSPIREDLHLPGPIQMLPSTGHVLTRLGPVEENEQLWRSLAPLTGANRLVRIKRAPGVQVLAASSDGRPLLVTGEYGQGRVLAFAADSTYRWPLAGNEREHKRFWRQVMLWLVRRDEQQPGQVWLQMPRRRYRVGERIEFVANVQTGSGDAIPEARIVAELALPDGQRSPLTLTPGADGWTGSIEPFDEPGDYSIEASATAPGQSLGAASARFQVREDDVELANPAADPDQLARLAELTSDAGGRFVAPSQVPLLLEDLLQRPPQLEIDVETRWQLADTAWDAWLFFLCVVALLSAEWALRKKWGLV